MKIFWNYLFYFTWYLHVIMAKYIFEKPLDYLFSLHPFLDNANRRGKMAYENTINNIECGFNIGYAFYFMLLIGDILFAVFLYFSCLFLEINIDNKPKSFVFIVLTFVFSYTMNELILGWHKDTYIKYFKMFQKNFNHFVGSIVTIIFHLTVISVGIAVITIS